MLSLSNELLKAFSKYLKAELSIEQFRDYMVGLRLEKYSRLADADRLFLNEFEGRYAEFSDFGRNEALLKSSLTLYLQADDVAAGTMLTFKSLRANQESTGSPSISFGADLRTGSFGNAAVVCAGR